MKDWKNIPIEILISIFKKLGRSDNAQCSITCRSWKSPAQYVLFENIPELTDTAMHKLLLTLSVYQDNSSNNSYSESPGNFVKTLICGRLCANVDTEILDTTFPFLEYIGPTDRELLYEIYKLMMDGKFVNLTEIPYSVMDDKYAEAVLERKSTITVLDLVEEYPGFESKMYQIMQEFHLFPKLTFLTLETSNEDALRYLNQLSNLKFVDICFMPCISSIWDLQHDYKKTPKDILLLDDDRVRPLASVRGANIRNNHYFSGGDKPYNYIMKNFPNVTNLNVHFGDEIQNYTVSTVACLSQFLIYIFNIKRKSSVTTIITDEVTAEVVGNLFTYVLHYRSLTSVNVGIYLSILFDINQLPSASTEPRVRTAYIEASNSQYNNDKYCKIKVKYKSNPQNTVQPYLELIKRVWEMDITVLDIGYELFPEDTYNRWSQTFELNTILNTCMKFKQLRFHHMNITCGEERYSPGETSVTAVQNLEFNFCGFNKDIFPKISKRCPNLRSLTIFGNGHFYQEDGNWVRSQVLPIIMPSTRLQELKIFVRRVPRIYISNLHLIIKLNTANKKPRYCELIEGEVLSLKSCSEVDYKSSLVDGNCAVYDIYCEAVENLIVKTMNGYPRDQIVTMRSFPEQDP